MGINRRLSSISSDRESFEKAAPPYQRALDASGYNHTLKFEPPRASPRRNRPRKNTLWYNPPFSKSMQTDIGKKFLTLVDKCFPHKNPLRKIFNRNTVKVSYSCTSNIKQAIDNHNKQKLAAYNGENTNPEEANAKLCNCRKKDSCPLNGECLQPAVIYQAKVTRSDNNQSETHVGLTESEFKTRYRNHTNSFRNAKSKNSTELSKYIWHLKENKIDCDITWSVIGHAKPYNSASKRCNLCLSEKYVIIYEPHRCTLNNLYFVNAFLILCKSYRAYCKFKVSMSANKHIPDE